MFDFHFCYNNFGDMMKHLFIVNPKAGVKNSVNQIKEEIESVFKGEAYDIHETTAPKDATHFVNEYLDNNKDDSVRVYACGGDGTMQEVAAAIANHKNGELAVYPSGSGNDFLKYYDASSALAFKSIKNLKEGETVTIDLVKVGDNIAINEFNIGFDANVVVKQAKIKRWPLVSGKFAYDIGVLSAFLGKIRSNYKITVDDKVVYEGVAVLGAVMNGNYYGGGYLCAPMAKVDDGLLDFCMVKNVKKTQFLGLIKDYKAGNHIKEDSKAYPFIIYEKGKKIRIEIDKEWPYSLDGEIYFTKDVTIEVIPNAIKFVLPLELLNK